LALMELRRHAGAARDFRECLAKRDTPALTPINRDIRKAGPHHCLAICLMYLKQLDAAGEAFQAALAADPQSRRVRFDFAVFLTERGLPVDALKTLHALVAEKADDAAAWQLGGRIALSQPEFLEFARDWTSEAIKQLPRDPVIKRQRTMACLLAALVQGEALPEVPAEIESILSREFVDWYRRGLSSGATTVVTAVNGRASELAGVLPGAGRVLQAALAAAMSA